ncbi:5'/3'-nucleotidase SurE [Halocynthiibacter namhaensis]|uniref:5'/3'-nucleotidase SurE n=1 Tax=Halocynthiibacter namhaensis TaxID=1290553 RepID=UPI000579113A|nr:5'/3'-nucleotidase SurE [Halocynthiibacter namhaensis]
MRILITNDDGIHAPGLKTLTKIAEDLAGPDGEVWIVAPAFEQSGVGHCISFTHPFLVAQHGPRSFAAEGSPADCVLTALHDVMPERPDLVLSGVNRGNNSGENTLYSGTIGAAMEAALQGIPAVAMSQYFGVDNRDLDDPFECAAAHAVGVIKRILAAPQTNDTADYRLFWNVNFPPVSATAHKGVRLSAQGFRRDVDFTVEPHHSPSGKRFLWIKGGPQQTPTLPGTDVTDNLNGYTSVTPMRADLTDHKTLTALKESF